MGLKPLTTLQYQNEVSRYCRDALHGRLKKLTAKNNVG